MKAKGMVTGYEWMLTVVASFLFDRPNLTGVANSYILMGTRKVVVEDAGEEMSFGSGHQDDDVFGWVMQNEVTSRVAVDDDFLPDVVFFLSALDDDALVTHH